MEISCARFHINDAAIAIPRRTKGSLIHWPMDRTVPNATTPVNSNRPVSTLKPTIKHSLFWASIRRFRATGATDLKAASHWENPESRSVPHAIPVRTAPNSPQSHTITNATFVTRSKDSKPLHFPFNVTLKRVSR